jgi:DNA helicase II / ATP-dependent DNA helicase PcrA
VKRTLAERFAAMPAAYLDTLNPDQRRAVEHGINGTGPASQSPGPVLVIAGAGSGKTTTLAHRVAHLVVKGADPHRILLLTFSRRAASVMAHRVERILAAAAPTGRHRLAWSGTFHAIGARLLRDYAEQIGLSPAFTIHDREDAADLMNLVRHDLGFSKTEQRFPTKATCLAVYSRVVNAKASLGAVLTQFFPWCAGWERELRALYAGYVEAKQRQNVLDYDDLLLYWAQLMGEGALAADISSRFDHVLVDEYQDTNRLQAEILLALKPDGAGVTVVGDDAQSIYSFRAATIRNILDFPNAFNPPATIVTLERNYRSTKPILAASNAVIALAAERFSKNLWSERPSSERPALVTVRDEAEQARYVIERVLENREAGFALKAQAVLFRTSHHSDVLEVELSRRNIPFVKFGGLKFLEAAHVKDLLACLRWIENPHDRIAGFRTLQLLPGVGPAAAAGFLDALAGHDRSLLLGSLRPPPKAAGAWQPFVDLIREMSQPRSDWPSELAQLRSWYQPYLEARYEDAVMRAADLVSLEQIAAEYPSRGHFLTELTLDPPDATSDEAGPPRRDEDYLVLSTIHSAKGQEWRTVFLINSVDGCLPSDLATGTSAEIEEERRLLYVAMTRAKDQLEIIVPQRFYTHKQTKSGDRHVYAARTRFLPAALMGLFEARSWPGAAARPADGARTRPQVRVDVGARLRDLWR